MKNRLNTGQPSRMRVWVWVFLVFMLCAVVFGCAPRHPVPDNLRQKIKSLCDKYPPPSGFTPLEEPRSITKSDRGTYGAWYSSTMNSKDLISYYEKILANDNWSKDDGSSFNISTASTTKYITFKKDGFNISLEFVDDEKLSVGEERTYGINCGFEP